MLVNFSLAVFTAAAENAAWDVSGVALKQYHEMGEEVLRTLAAATMLPIAIRHLTGPRIAGEVTARTPNGVLLRLRRAFSGQGSVEVDLQIGPTVKIFKQSDLEDLDACQARVQAICEEQGVFA